MTDKAESKGDQPHKRVWAQEVNVGVDALTARLDTIKARPGGLFEVDQATYKGVQALLRKAKKAANGEDPIHLRVSSWWHGTLIEAAYQNLHAAEAEIAMLYDEAEVDAEFPEAIGRVQASLNRDDPRRVEATRSNQGSLAQRRARLRKLIDVGHNAVDRQHSRLRSFRNVVLMTAILIACLIVLFILLVRLNPRAFPLCFQPDANGPRVCPAGEGTPSAYDVIVIAVLGLLGGALGAAVSIRNLGGTSTPYDIPVALAWLKVFAGALTAIGGIIAIRGNFIPGLSQLDSQEQVLAYALAFGYAQQLFTGAVDKRALSLIDAVPSKGSEAIRPPYDMTQGRDGHK